MLFLKKCIVHFKLKINIIDKFLSKIFCKNMMKFNDKFLLPCSIIHKLLNYNTIW